MNFRIVWVPGIEQKLAQIWLDAPDRSAISEAVDELEIQLRSNPFKLGESRNDAHDLRIVFHGPVAVTIRVNTVVQAVYVVDIQSIRKKR